MLWRRGSLPHAGFRDQICQGQCARHGSRKVQRGPHAHYLGDLLNACGTSATGTLGLEAIYAVPGFQRQGEVKDVRKETSRDTTSQRKSNREKYSHGQEVGWGRGKRESHWNIKLENTFSSLKRRNAIVIQASPWSAPSWFHKWTAYLILHFAILSYFVISYGSGRSEGYHRHATHRCC